MNMPSFHQTELFACIAAYLQPFEVEFPGERVESSHDIADGAIAMISPMGRLCFIGKFQHARIGLPDHLLAVVNSYQIFLEDVVVKHILGCFTQIQNPLTQWRGLDTVGHILCVNRAGGVVITADTADAAGDEVGITRIFALHKKTVASKDRRSAMAFRYFPILEVDLGIDAKAANDACNRIPRHLYKL